jgi:hypothetical protein
MPLPRFCRRALHRPPRLPGARPMRCVHWLPCRSPALPRSLWRWLLRQRLHCLMSRAHWHARRVRIAAAVRVVLMEIRCWRLESRVRVAVMRRHWVLPGCSPRPADCASTRHPRHASLSLFTPLFVSIVTLWMCADDAAAACSVRSRGACTAFAGPLAGGGGGGGCEGLCGDAAGDDTARRRSCAPASWARGTGCTAAAAPMA